jgi:hypothetical protein
MVYEYLKKNMDEQLGYNVLDLSERVNGEYFFNYSEKINTDSTALQEIHEYSKSTRAKIRTDYITLGILANRAYMAKMLSYLPGYMRKDPYINALYEAYESKLIEVDGEEQKLESDLNINTTISRLVEYEDDYRIENKISYGIVFRRNTVIAKRIAKYLYWNTKSINIYSKLYMLGNVRESINDKQNFHLTIILEEPISNWDYLNEFIKFINEIGPAYYEFEVRN